VALSKLAANSFDLTDNYAFTGTTTGATSTQKIFLIKNIDASGSSNISFVNGSSSVVLDNTYKTYLFRWINIHPSGSGGSGVSDWRVNFRDGGSNFDATKTTTAFHAWHSENDSDTQLGYNTSVDVAETTGDATLSPGGHVGGGDDESTSGYMYLFNPSSTTFVKHFISVNQNYYNGTYSIAGYVAGYCNTTTAIDGVTFNFNSGNIDAGRIALYGIK
tara:strand:+ start:496 stop:1149 length:654 start_codon:yes stop_codon:yes gene_type:complete